MRTLLLPRHDPDFQFAKAGLLEPLMQLHLAEAEPLVGVKLTRTLEAVAEQVQNDEPPALRETGGLMMRCFYELAEQYPGIQADVSKRPLPASSPKAKCGPTIWVVKIRRWKSRKPSPTTPVPKWARPAIGSLAASGLYPLPRLASAVGVSVASTPAAVSQFKITLTLSPFLDRRPVER